MSATLLSLLLVAIVNAGLGLLVYLRNPKHLVNKLFACFVLCASGWTLCNYMIHSATDMNRMQLFWGRVIFAAASLIALSFFYFSTAFPDRKSIHIGKLFLLFTSCGIIIALIAPSNLIVKAIKLADDPTQAKPAYEPIFGMAYPVFAIYFLSCFGYGLLTLGMKWRRSRGIHRLQIQYIFLGVFLTAISGTTTNLLIPLLFHTSRYSLYGPLFSIFTIALTAHAIVRHRLMDIRLVLKKGLVYLASIATVAVIGVALVFGFKPIEQPPLFSIVIILLLAVGFEYIRKGIELLINRYFYRPTSNYQKILQQASQVLTVLDLQQLLDYLTNLILRTVMVDSVSILLYDESKGTFESKLRRTYLAGDGAMNISLTERSTLIETLRRGDELLIRDEIEKRFPAYLADRLLAEMSELSVEVVFGMSFQDNLIGLIGIGGKLSGDAYFTEDLEILNLISNETAIAVRNAQLYQKVASLELERNQAQQLVLIGTLVASLAHELKNPLQPIRTLAELFSEKSSDPELKDFSRIAIAEIERMSNLLAQFQNLADSKPPKLTPVDLVDVLEDTLLFLGAKLMKQRVEVVRHYSPSLPKVKADASQLKQVFLNLLLNSSEAIVGPGEIRLKSFVVSSASSQQVETQPLHPPLLSKGDGEGTSRLEGMVSISISDTGSGIAGENLQKIFTPFFTTKEGGTGLGLATCHRIVSNFKGKIEIQNNKEGKGVTITIYLPIYTEEKEVDEIRIAPKRSEGID